MELRYWATTDVGRVRDHNEDNFLVDKRLKLFIVCDGMGGHAAGEVASAMSVRLVREYISEHREVFERLHEDPDSLPHRKAVLQLLEHAIQNACQKVWQAAQEDIAKRGMGTTCSLLVLHEGRGFIGHVGDSRVYLYRQGQVHQVTEDHSLINEMIRMGKIKPGEGQNIPQKNAVTRAVGVSEFVEVETFELDVFAEDAFLVCSDGLSGYFDTADSDQPIIDIFEVADVKDATKNAIDFANAGGGKDNITCILVRVDRTEVETRDIQRTMDVLRVTPYFQYLSYKELVQMVNLSRRVEFAKGSNACTEGEGNDELYLIIDGAIRLETAAGGTLAELVTGDHFCETSIIVDEPSRYTAVATDDSVLLALRRDRFMDLMRQDPQLAVKLLWNYVQTFAGRLRTVPVETFYSALVDGVADPTPSRGIVGDDPNVPPPRNMMNTVIVPDAEEKAAADAEIGGHLSWEHEPVADLGEESDVLDEEELRATVAMDAQDRDEIERNDAAHAATLRGMQPATEPLPQKPSEDVTAEEEQDDDPYGLGPGISGESVVRKKDGAAKKSLVIGGGDNAPTRERSALDSIPKKNDGNP